VLSIRLRLHNSGIHRLAAGAIQARADRSGVLYFPRPPNAEGGTFVIPIVDLDDAVRYSVRVPLPVK
jgi:hypothetical protein